MASYNFTVMHGRRDAHGTYSFEAADDLMTHSPVRVMKVAMEHMDEMAHIGHIDYHLFSCLKDKETGIVTALGNFVFHGDDVQPFTAFISRA
ncbi:MAG: hypothetical protein AAGC86_05430 [Pseudomonadota bacterium]